MKYRNYAQCALMIATLVIVTSTQVACEDHNWSGDGFRGRSDSFVGRDINGDDKLTRSEWEHAGGTLVNDPFLIWFDRMDCEGDGVVTWSEYYRHNWNKRNRCARIYRAYPSGIKDRNFDTQRRWQVPTFCSPREAIAESMKQHTESDVSSEQLDKVELACTEPAKGVPPVTGRVNNKCSIVPSTETPPTEKLFSDFSITNNNPNVTITLIRFSLTSEVQESEVAMEEKHIKTVLVAPNSTQTFRAWFESGTSLARSNERSSCTLEAVKAKLL